MDNAVEIDLGIAMQLPTDWRAFGVLLIEEGEMPDNLRVLLNRFQEIEGPKEPPSGRLA